MRKVLIFLNLFFVLCFLCGCEKIKVFSPLAHEYLVSALGFDQYGREKAVIIETIVVNSEDSGAEKRKEQLIGRGSSLKEAFKNATKKAVQPIRLEHCAVAVIGEDVTASFFDEICEYIYNEKELTIALGMAATNNAKELLSGEAVASVAVGYDIMSMQQTYSREKNVKFKNRFYEVEIKRIKEKSVSLPFFKVGADGYFIEGEMLFEKGLPKQKRSKNLLEVIGK